jgi:hypothetical protein
VEASFDPADLATLHAAATLVDEITSLTTKVFT